MRGAGTTVRRMGSIRNACSPGYVWYHNNIKISNFKHVLRCIYDHLSSCHLQLLNGYWNLISVVSLWTMMFILYFYMLLFFYPQPYCEIKTHKNANGNVIQYSSACMQKEACDNHEEDIANVCAKNPHNKICRACTNSTRIMQCRGEIIFAIPAMSDFSRILFRQRVVRKYFQASSLCVI